jgi:hypothetical protein
MEMILQTTAALAADKPVLIPHDSEDPFIFHSLGRGATFETGIRLLKNDASLTPLYMTHQHRGFSRKAELLKSPEVQDLVYPWRRSGVESRGIIHGIDSIAGDNRYVFTTPGFVFSTSQCVFAFRYSTIKARAKVLFRCEDLILDYEDLLIDFQKKFNLSIEVKNPADRRNLFSPGNSAILQDFLRQLHEIVDAGTLNERDSGILIPAFVKARNSDKPLDPDARQVIEAHVSKFSGSTNKYVQSVVRKWRKYNRELLRIEAETLVNGILPLRAAEYVFEPRRLTWHPTNSFLNTPLSGLGRSMLRPNRRLLIPASRQR